MSQEQDEAALLASLFFFPIFSLLQIQNYNDSDPKKKPIWILSFIISIWVWKCKCHIKVEKFSSTGGGVGFVVPM